MYSFTVFGTRKMIDGVGDYLAILPRSLDNSTDPGKIPIPSSNLSSSHDPVKKAIESSRQKTETSKPSPPMIR
jgi:hypothetical protein